MTGILLDSRINESLAENFLFSGEICTDLTTNAANHFAAATPIRSS
jgi:hypothetical protein